VAEQVRISARTAENHVLVELQDTGPGIPGCIRDRLFEPFVTAGKQDGLGLGLAVSRQAVVDHGGDTWIDQRPVAGLLSAFLSTGRGRFRSGEKKLCHRRQAPIISSIAKTFFTVFGFATAHSVEQTSLEVAAMRRKK
jgi:signal transduction histidine kinase